MICRPANPEVKYSKSCWGFGGSRPFTNHASKLDTEVLVCTGFYGNHRLEPPPSLLC